MKNFLLLLGVIFLSQIYWVYRLNYPPSFEQLALPLSASWQLWLLRLSTLVLLGWSFVCLTRLMKPDAKQYFWLLVLISPVPVILCLSYPISALKICLIILIILKTGKSLPAKILSLILISSLLFFVNVKLLHQSPSIIGKFSLSTAQINLTDRFNKEYLLHPGNPVPLLIKRLAYNKYFFVVKGVFEEILRALNDSGYQGPLSGEWEDCGMDRDHGAKEACEFVKRIDFEPSRVAFDAAFDKEEQKK